MANKEISSRAGHAAGRDVTAAAAPVNNVHEITGGTNIIGNHGAITIVTGIERAKQPLAPVPPPSDHISGEQAAELKRLHGEWVQLSEDVKTRAKPITPQQAWIAINRAGQSRTYTHMRQANYDAARAYVQQQMAILRSGKTARRRDPKWRNSRIGAIKARCINQLGNEYAYKPYIAKHFNAQSLTELDDEQLEATYRHTLGLKARAR